MNPFEDPFNINHIRPDMRQALADYANHGKPVGDFLRAIITNDFKLACGKADSDNQRVLLAYSGYVTMNLPMICHGSVRVYQAWLLLHAAEKADIEGEKLDPFLQAVYDAKEESERAKRTVGPSLRLLGDLHFSDPLPHEKLQELLVGIQTATKAG